MALLDCFPEIHLCLSTLYGHACFSLSCPCGRTMFEFNLVLSSYFAVSFSWVSSELRIDAQRAVPYFCFPVWISTLLTGKCIRNCLYFNWLSNQSLAKRSFWKVVLADSCRGFNLATSSSSVSYRECVRYHACQEGRKFAPVHAIWPYVFLSVLSLWQNYVWVYPCFVVFSPCVIFVGVSGVTCWCAACGSLLLLSSVNFDPLDR